MKVATEMNIFPRVLARQNKTSYNQLHEIDFSNPSFGTKYYWLHTLYTRYY